MGTRVGPTPSLVVYASRGTRVRLTSGLKPDKTRLCLLKEGERVREEVSK